MEHVCQPPSLLLCAQGGPRELPFYVRSTPFLALFASALHKYLLGILHIPLSLFPLLTPSPPLSFLCFWIFCLRTLTPPSSLHTQSSNSCCGTTADLLFHTKYAEFSPGGLLPEGGSYIGPFLKSAMAMRLGSVTVRWGKWDVSLWAEAFRAIMWFITFSFLSAERSLSHFCVSLGPREKMT